MSELVDNHHDWGDAHGAHELDREGEGTAVEPRPWAKAAPARRDKPKGPRIPEPPKGTVLTFSKSYGVGADKSYLYVAIKVRKNAWYITGRHTGPLTWADLLEFIGDGERDGLGWRTIRVATGWAGVNE